ncbi:hypothetical protein [Pseudomonas sp. S36]|uniref:hypothetical protein n=1 Tax=Pseudomonas sp. S36 TaxID=2767447 RepID=UPI001F1864B9|nr:hypothetical protein [Pseudomonas sp. S36]MBK4990010.1 hypothetical protein [Pseudomonas sp. S36]
MSIDHNITDTDEGHGSGLEQTPSEPKQGAGENGSQKRPEDWNPPPGNPGSDQDSQVPRDNGTARTHEDEARDADVLEEDMKDVEANNSVSNEHP